MGTKTLYILFLSGFLLIVSAISTQWTSLSSLQISLIISGSLLVITSFYLLLPKNKPDIQKILTNTLLHDMATPISILSMLLPRIEKEVEKEKWLKIQYVNDRLTEILQKSRDIQSHEIHPKNIELSICDLNHCIEQAIPKTSKNIKIEIDVPDSTKVFSEPEILSQKILGNLIHNAIKHNDEDVEISITYTNKKQLCIRDNGNGIVTEKLSSIYDTKKLLNGSGISKQKGSGLGLIEAFYFSKLLGLDLNINSDPASSGSEVTLQFNDGRNI